MGAASLSIRGHYDPYVFNGYVVFRRETLAQIFFERGLEGTAAAAEVNDHGCPRLASGRPLSPSSQLWARPP